MKRVALKKKIERRSSKISKSTKLKREGKRNADSSESNDEEAPLQKKSNVEKQEWKFMEAQFSFYKVGKSTPTKEFVTLIESPVHLTLDALKEELLVLLWREASALITVQSLKFLANRMNQ